MRMLSFIFENFRTCGDRLIGDPLRVCGAKMQRECTSNANLTHDGNSTAERFCNFLREREPQAGASYFSGEHVRTAIEGVENALEFRRPDPAPVILDPEGNLGASIGLLEHGRETNPPIGAAIFGSVADQVLQADTNTRQVAP